MRFGKRFGWVKTGLGALVIIILGWTAVHFLTPAPAEVSLDETRTVTVAAVSDLSANASPLSVAGTVSSKSQASVLSQAGGQITSVNYKLGDYVGAGAVVASVDNASQRAAVAQAQGAVDAASAGASVSQTSLSSAKSGAVTALLSAYSTADKVVHADIDPMFSNPNSADPRFNIQSTNSQAAIDAQNERTSLAPIFTRESGVSSSLTASSDLSTELSTAQAELRAIRDFLDSVISALNGGIATNGVTTANISAYLATANGDRASVVSALSALATAQAAIETASTGADTQNGSSGAALAQAKAGLAAAQAALEKTIIRAPISGTINSLSLKVGDYLAAGTVAVVIANNGALEVTAYVTDTDASQIAVGGRATIETANGTALGTITQVAPAIDPQTKKIEVKIGITSGESDLLNGQSVTVSLARKPQATSATASSTITLPLSALKVGADDISVFTVSASSTLEAHVVTLGELLGDRVVVASGLTPDMKIVTDARGLQPGQTVIVK
ncbi:MAG TPA: efflux RND transporter periplasmic adaptor subunit [Candidatus Paceibacterota bacterium]|nr:efflux RND transporter periplasmic adaptor subunit [Candidatus Paceibacterota bacterium]